MVHVRLNVVPTSEISGVYVVLRLVAVPKAPAPPLQVPAPLAVAVMLTGLVPHAVYGPPALAVAAGFTVTDALEPKLVPVHPLLTAVTW